ncbi:phage gp6-like head-tail connector protein [Microbacterium sp. cf332]|uniref:phage gp6-like head-tail connector protein n=1 Tax=Microbacterium sp. cf332 TaxID=1761804 RepID=UPI00088FF9FE|nr:phage gp6-like head-tail connector protein [Microbacterium sp. cf332]SDQ11080.1 hypothetical protein SAMN04487847_0401 [Microbacterium sp. cf332]
MITLADLKAYLDIESTKDDPFIGACAATADALLGAYVGDAVVPEVILERAALEVGAELFIRRATRGANAGQIGTLEGPTFRTARDPLTGVYAMLAPFVGPGVA